MNFERFIARHISTGRSDSYAKPVVRISYVSIALGLALMIISIAVVIGFKQTISDKIIGFTSHLKIIPFDNNQSFEEKPVSVNQELIESLDAIPEIVHYQLTAQKAGVIKTADQIQGVIFKGIGNDYNPDFLETHLAEGSFPNLKLERTNEVLISVDLLTKLNLKIGDYLRVWFVSGTDGNTRGRRFEIAGTFDTSLEEFDHIFIIGDVRHIQRINDWKSDQFGSIEVTVSDAEKLNDIAFSMYNSLPFNLRVVTVKEEYPQIFNWLELLDVNVIVILVLLVTVAAITMISTLLILIMERTSMVGVLKALGANNLSIRKIFLYKSSSIMLRGIIWGNFFGIGFVWVQYYFNLIRLSPENYYMDYVPVDLNWFYFFLLNLGTITVCFIILIIPSYYITRLNPSKALRYE